MNSELGSTYDQQTEDHLEALPAELVCSRLATTTQHLGAHLSMISAIHLPAKAAIHSAHEDVCTTFGDLHPADEGQEFCARCNLHCKIMRIMHAAAVGMAKNTKLTYIWQACSHSTALPCKAPVAHVACIGQRYMKRLKHTQGR